MSKQKQISKIKRFYNCKVSLYKNLIVISEKFEPLLNLVMRLWIAGVFWKSGLTKISNWDNTLMLFEYEYAVPLLPVSFAAFSATTFELVCPVLLALGLGTRLAVLPLIAMTAVIQFTYQDNVEHYYWAMILFALLIRGAGKFSADYILKKKHFS